MGLTLVGHGSRSQKTATPPKTEQPDYKALLQSKWQRLNGSTLPEVIRAYGIQVLAQDNADLDKMDLLAAFTHHRDSEEHKKEPLENFGLVIKLGQLESTDGPFSLKTISLEKLLEILTKHNTP